MGILSSVDVFQGDLLKAGPHSFGQPSGGDLATFLDIERAARPHDVIWRVTGSDNNAWFAVS